MEVLQTLIKAKPTLNELIKSSNYEFASILLNKSNETCRTKLNNLHCLKYFINLVFC